MRAKTNARLCAGSIWENLTTYEQCQAIQLTKAAVRAKRAGRRALKRGQELRAVKQGLLGINFLRERQEIYEEAKKKQSLERFLEELHAIPTGLRDDVARSEQEGERDA